MKKATHAKCSKSGDIARVLRVLIYRAVGSTVNRVYMPAE
jgi:hypothetical protein